MHETAAFVPQSMSLHADILIYWWCLYFTLYSYFAALRPAMLRTGGGLTKTSVIRARGILPVLPCAWVIIFWVMRVVHWLRDLINLINFRKAEKHYILLSVCLASVTSHQISVYWWQKGPIPYKGGVIKIFWSIELNDPWSKKIYGPEMIVWSGAISILRLSCTLEKIAQTLQTKMTGV